MRPKIYAYYFPDYHEDARNAAWFGEGWTEWELVKRARPRIPGHYQPRVPADGWTDEADPATMTRHTGWAADAGIDGFLFDFYWYEDGPYLQRALDEGFLGARIPEGFEFSLMWANHTLHDIFPMPAEGPATELAEGAIGRDAFERMARHIVERYFSHPAYTRIEDRPRFSIYETATLIRGLGGVEATRDALEWFDARAREAGHAGVHLDCVMFRTPVLPGEAPLPEPETLLPALGYRSASAYVWVHEAPWAGLAPGLQGNVADLRESAYRAYESYAASLPVPFHPNVSAGWDSTPRMSLELPEAPIYWDFTPGDFAEGLRRARRFLDEHPAPYQEVTINAWNEWTEGSYLLPDERDGTAKLDAIREVFGPRVLPGRA